MFDRRIHERPGHFGREELKTELTAIVAALGREITPLVRRLEACERIATPHGRFMSGRLVGRPVIVGWTGDGAESAEAALRSLLDRCEVSQLVGLGVAGGLSPGLGVSDLVAAGEVRDNSGKCPPPSAELLERTAAAEAALGTTYTCGRILATAEAKAETWRRLGTPEVATVDLENAAWARVAAEHSVPYAIVRAVSDPAGEDLPLDFERYRDAQGRVRQGRIALQVLRRPGLIGPLRELERRVVLCAERLADCAEQLVVG